MKRVLVAALLLAAGCADAGRQVVVSPGEYAAYRRYRFAPTVLAKLGSGFSYLKSNPKGVYGDEVRAFLVPTTESTLARGWNDPESLEALLRAVPSGRVADRAAARLVELELTAEYRARQDSAFDERVRGLEGRLASAEKGRRQLVGGVVAWARRLAAIRTFGGRTSDLGGDFVFAYRLTEPAARCTDDGCTKSVTVAYSVPEGKTQSDRLAVYDVVLELKDGGVRGAAVTGPDLFTRLGEAMSVRAVAPDDALGRAEAIGQATQLLAGALEIVLPSATCAKEAVSPVVLERRCGGVRVRAFSATTLGEEDRVLFEPDTKSAP